MIPLSFEQRLTDGWRQAWRWWTMRLNAIGSLLLGFILAYPTLLPDFVHQLPKPMQDKLWLAAPVWFGAVAFARLWKQGHAEG
jgi:hypothetical protein